MFMNENLNLAGACMCGAVKVTATANKPSVSVCHCDMCRRWSAGPFMAVACQAVNFEGQENINRIRSSDWAERGFCTACGSNLFYHIVDLRRLSDFCRPVRRPVEDAHVVAGVHRIQTGVL